MEINFTFFLYYFIINEKGGIFMDEIKKEKYVPKIIALIAFVIILIALNGAILADCFIFLEYILSFIIAIIASCFLFLLFFIAMIVSYIFVFGFYLTEQYGFWPLSLSKDVFHQIINDALISQEQLQAFIILRIVLITTCLICFIMAIISASLDKKERKLESLNVKTCKPFNVITIILSILGIVVGFGMLFIIQGV